MLKKLGYNKTNEFIQRFNNKVNQKDSNQKIISNSFSLANLPM